MNILDTIRNKKQGSDDWNLLTIRKNEDGTRIIKLERIGSVIHIRLYVAGKRFQQMGVAIWGEQIRVDRRNADLTEFYDGDKCILLKRGRVRVIRKCEQGKTGKI